LGWRWLGLGLGRFGAGGFIVGEKLVYHVMTNFGKTVIT
jgi:hypothetical protein